MLKFFEDNDECPTCRQTIDEVFKTEQIKSRKSKLGEIEKGMSELSSSIQKIESRMKTIQDTVVAIREKEMLIEDIKLLKVQTNILILSREIDN